MSILTRSLSYLASENVCSSIVLLDLGYVNFFDTETRTLCFKNVWLFRIRKEHVINLFLVLRIWQGILFWSVAAAGYPLHVTVLLEEVAFGSTFFVEDCVKNILMVGFGFWYRVHKWHEKFRFRSTHGIRCKQKVIVLLLGLLYLGKRYPLDFDLTNNLIRL